MRQWAVWSEAALPTHPQVPLHAMFPEYRGILSHIRSSAAAALPAFLRWPVVSLTQLTTYYTHTTTEAAGIPCVAAVGHSQGVPVRRQRNVLMHMKCVRFVGRPKKRYVKGHRFDEGNGILWEATHLQI